MDEKLEEKQSADIKRMAAFIKHEAQEKASEIRQQALEEYNTEKARVVLNETEKIDKQHEQDIKNTELNSITKISDIRRDYQMQYLRCKENIINKFFDIVKRKLNQKNSLQKSLFMQTLQGIDKKEVIIFLNEDDRKNVTVWAKEAGLEFKFDVLDPSLLGGVVIKSMDHKVVCDNSYASRINSIMSHHLHEISGHIFPQ